MTKIAEFKIKRNLLISALTHISNITHKASIALIVDRNSDNAKMGITFNNVVHFDESGHQFDLYSSYPIFHSEMACNSYYIENVDDWPIVYIACMPEFIVSISTLPPITSDGEDFLDMALWNVRDGTKIKSEVVIFGNHHSHIASIIEHADILSRDASGAPRIISSLPSRDDIGEVPRISYG